MNKKQFLIFFACCLCLSILLKGKKSILVAEEPNRSELISELMQGEANKPIDYKSIYNEASSFKVVLEALHHTVIAGEITSPVAKVHKKMGDTIQTGEILIQLEDVIFKSNYNKAKAKLEKAEVQASVLQRLYQDKSASLFELKDAQDNLATAQAEFTTAEKALQATQITAPYDGKVVRIIINLYELVQPGKEIIEIVDDHLLYATFLVPSNYYSDIKTGEKVRMYLNETNELVDAKVVRVSPIIEPVSGTIKVEAEINNEDSRWSAGMIGFLKFDQKLTSPSLEYAERENHR